jgi:hypothetical protein
VTSRNLPNSKKTTGETYLKLGPGLIQLKNLWQVPTGKWNPSYSLKNYAYSWRLTKIVSRTAPESNRKYEYGFTPFLFCI